MIYLDEFSVKFQIASCQQINESKGVYCPRCKCTKPYSKLCKLGESWQENPNEKENQEQEDLEVGLFGTALN
mgnify:CR=1 FL=1